jgi:hypothetical protein
MSEQKKGLSTANSLRIIGIAFLAVFALGLSSFASDLSVSLHWGVSSISTMATVFGALGFLICEINARRCDKW